ncbi:PaaX family transcriptional regulator C-terminal domain-containing protein [Nocardioides sp. QY071]|uniref:PaaX family transcriptional regulator n=1 Tax=Nocardioides sp. QY071 TaxID=3044187 RepID=UPI00249A683C|nr:PaaX family transcriptional regulator C-terminal domain-containing protein [Nocardioides sp. QY071]WGY00346.1 PaaX family transcriptional regulator C-terminal domain-containing protein [Nocardioides sp. QY071]
MSDSGPTAQRNRRSRTTVVTFLGAVVRPLGNWMPIAGTVDLLTQAGLDAASVRTAVHRLKVNGWLDSEARDGTRGYALTDTALATLESGDEVIWHARTPADLADGWCIVHFGVPESKRARRHQLRAHLSHLGFGNIGTALWIAPARMRDAAERAVVELGLEDHSAIFVGAYHGTQDLTQLLYSSWDLTAIDTSYRAFADEYDLTAAAVERTPPSPADAFATYVAMLDQWRKLPFRDPGLPSELLAADWNGPRATTLFERLVNALEKPSLEHAATRWPDGTTAL